MPATELDYVTSNPNAAPGACTGSLPSSSNIQQTLRMVNSAIGDNITTLVVTALVTLTSAGVTWYVVANIVRMFNDWHRRTRVSSNTRITQKDNVDLDNAIYSDGATGLDDLPMQPEAAAVAGMMKQVSSTYKRYNDAIKVHAANRDEQPDDIIDQRIISRSDDDFRYPHRGQDQLRFRRGAGMQKVYASFAEGDIGLRSPVYKTS